MFRTHDKQMNECRLQNTELHAQDQRVGLSLSNNVMW